jgi:hypothetical protein
MKDKIRNVINTLKEPKKLPRKAKDYINNQSSIVRANYRVYKKLGEKIKRGESSLKEKLEFKSKEAYLLSLPLNAFLVGAVPGGLPLAMVLNSARSSVSGDSKSNKTLLKKLRAGEQLSKLEKSRLKRATNLEKHD